MSEIDSRNPFEDAPVIFQYTRAQALEDGVLVDLTEWARESGFKFPVACTAAVWNGYIVPSEKTRALGQSERGRAHDVLWMLFNAIRRCAKNQDQLLFKVLFLQTPNRHVMAQLKSVCGPGDQGEPVITIMLTGED
jgi:hypothetical protein